MQESLPPSRIAARSQYSASAMKWVVTITVTPVEASAVILCQNSRRAKGSAPLVGSSRKRISGRWRRAAAMARRCLYPPGNWALGNRSKGFEPELPHSPRDPIPFPFASKAVRSCEEIQVLCHRQLPIERKLLRDVTQCAGELRPGARRTSTPATSQPPPEAGKSPHSMRKVVVLPAPFGPSSPNISPRLTLKLTWLTATNRRSSDRDREPRSLCRPRRR